MLNDTTTSHPTSVKNGSPDTGPTSPENIGNLEHERFASLINSMADGVITTDKTGKVVMYNGAALNLLDRNGSIKGRSVGSVLKLTDDQDEPVDTKRLVTNTATQLVSRDYRLPYDDGSFISLYLSVTPVRLGYGRQDGGFIVLLRDITREKSLEEERNEFISVVSHELRTPVAIAEGNLSNVRLLLERGGPPQAITEAAAQAHDQVIFLGGLINDLAMLSRAERNLLEVNVEPLNMFTLLKNLVQTYARSAEEKGLYLRLEPDPALETLRSCELYVREIIQNFITNAIKYTETGGITVRATAVRGGVKVTVADTGIGISKSDQEKVFLKFYRSEDFRTRQHSGTGLGLYVTKKLAKLVHAELDLSSELNKGTTFSIFFPNLVQTVSPE